jgi:hypothetical protein
MTSIQSQVPYSLLQSSSHEKPSSEKSKENVYCKFSRNLGYEVNLEKPKSRFFQIAQGIKNTVLSDIHEANVRNFARENVGKIYHSFEDGNTNTNSTNKLFKSIRKMDYNTTHENLGPNLTKLCQYFKSYSNYLCNKEKKNNIRETTIHLFQNMISLIPDKKKEDEAKIQFQNIIEYGSKIVNNIKTSSQEDCIYQYFNACENFMNIIFLQIEKNSVLAPLKKIIINGISTAGLLLTYMKRAWQEKVFVWTKRLFVPICFIIHELCGVGLQLLVNPYIFAATSPGIAWTLSLMLAFAVGYGLVNFIEFLVDEGIEVAQHRVDSKAHTNKIDLKKKVGLYTSNDTLEPEPTNGYFINWCDHISTSTKNNLNDLSHSIQKKTVKTVSFLMRANNKIEINEAKVKNDLNKEKAWYGNYTKKTEEMKTYLNKINPHINQDQINKLFYLQNKYQNNSDHLPEEEKKDLKIKIKKLAKSISKNVIERSSPKDRENEDIMNYVEIRIQNYSKALAYRPKNIFQHITKHSAPLTYGTFDLASDTMGVVFTSIIEDLGLEASMAYLGEIFGTVFGALPVVFVGILTHLSIKAAATAMDDMREKHPNEHIKDYISQYRKNKKIRHEDKQKGLEKNDYLFTSAQQFKLNKSRSRNQEYLSILPA